ncbi:hypothetical protein MCNF_27410 [Mycolicibacterium confluentis]|uniref:Uncharacterized protein n=1 Tax=Mycolicibacterium confluentis TaxID=28047 RepID=A0A7I7XXU3_9MYCO|nr:hypothetical protein MCNF_27410 [Mycolicibacterium confluentis]
MIAIGHRIERSTVAVLGALVRGRNGASRALRRPVGVDSASVTNGNLHRSARGAYQAGQYVSVDGALPLSR